MVACLSEEVVYPERNMPIGIVGSLVISATIYVLVSLVVIGMAPIDLLGEKVPIVNALLANACCTHDEQVQPMLHLLCLHSSACTPLVAHGIGLWWSSCVLWSHLWINDGYLYESHGTTTHLLSHGTRWIVVWCVWNCRSSRHEYRREEFSLPESWHPCWHALSNSNPLPI